MSYNQSYNESVSSNDDISTEEVSLLVTYLNMVAILIVSVIVITPAVIVINVIWQIRELHTKHYFLVAKLLVTDIIYIVTRSVMKYLIAILYLLDLNSASATVVIQFLMSPMVKLLQLITILLPATIAIERMIVIRYPYRHRSIITTKMVISTLAAIWGVSLILVIIIAIVAPLNIAWPLATTDYGATIFPFLVIPRLISAVFITVANVFVQYEVYVSNKKAKENQRLGNEPTEETKQLVKIVKLLRTQVKPTIALLLIGGIDTIGNLLIPLLYVANETLLESSERIYVKQLLLYPIASSLLAAHPLVYGLYMKKIRRRLPSCTACLQRQWTTRRSRVVTLRPRH